MKPLDPVAMLQANLPIVIGVLAVLVVSLGILVAVVRAVLTSAAERGRVERARAWAAGVYGLWSGLEDSATWAPDRARNSLKSWYGVTTGQQLGQLIDDLESGSTGRSRLGHGPGRGSAPEWGVAGGVVG